MNLPLLKKTVFYGLYLCTSSLFVFFINLNFENQWNHLYCFYTGPSIRSDHVLYVSVYRRLNKDYQLQEVAHDVYKKKEYLS